MSDLGPQVDSCLATMIIKNWSKEPFFSLAAAGNVPSLVPHLDVCKAPMSRRSRYGLRLKKRSPESFKRMRAILGYYDQPTSLKSEEPAVESVTLSLLQTLKYLPLEGELKKRLLSYKTHSLN
eukprot:scaffold48344_cov19-Tisochrysis_lutea.AAC.3